MVAIGPESKSRPLAASEIEKHKLTVFAKRRKNQMTEKSNHVRKYPRSTIWREHELSCQGLRVATSYSIKTSLAG